MFYLQIFELPKLFSESNCISVSKLEGVELEHY